MHRTLVLRITGSAEQVFSVLRYYAVNWGKMTLGEIITKGGGKQFPTFVEREVVPMK